MILQKKVIVSFPTTENSADNNEPDYIFDIDFTSDSLHFLLSLSNNNVSYFDTESLVNICSIDGHEDRINCLQSSKRNPSIFFTASSDNTSCIWDIRSANDSPTMVISHSAEALSISAGIDDILIAVSSGHSIYFYDARYNGKKSLGEYADCHTDLVNTLKFLSTQPSYLISGGEDGLVCVFDTSVSAQDSAVISICNTESPISRLSLFGPSEEGLLCISSIETATAWHYPTSQRIGNYPNIRADIALDYLVDSCYSEANDSLLLIGGKHDGSAILLSVEPDVCTPLCNLKDGHRSTVRCAKFRPGPSPSLLLTGGEDGRVCVWSTHSNSSVMTTDPRVSGGKATRGINAESQSLLFAPY